MNKDYELLLKIKERPGLYLGNKSLKALEIFFAGYAICCDMFSVNMETNLFDGFQEYIQAKYKITSTQGWAKIIDFYSYSDSDAFDNFFKLFEEFLKEKQ